MQSCELFSQCGFLRRYGQEIAAVCQLAVKTFCRGPKQADCARKTFLKVNGVMPSDALLPTGTRLID